jgi:Flp pilus assembly protein TadG
MKRRSTRRHRKGIFLVWATFLIIPIMAFVAMAIDLGVVMTARSQCQNAADVAAMAGARTLNGDAASNFNYANASPNAITAASTNEVLTSAVEPDQVQVDVGTYTYNEVAKKFEAQIPGEPDEPYTLVRTRVDYSGEYRFARVLGMTSFNTTATATAVHRPRDVCVVLDFSGSMRFDTLLGIQPNPGTSTGGVQGRHLGSNNPEAVFPEFGHYADTASAALQNPNAITDWEGRTFGSANWTVDTNSGPEFMSDFFPDLTPAPDSYSTDPAGDIPLRANKNNASNFAETASQVIYNNTSGTQRDDDWETGGYDEYAEAFSGYTLGPRYWGKTFWIWPPDPRPGMDWRGRFFKYPGTSTPIDDNTRLYDSSGNWKAPSSTTYAIDYDSILDWIKNVGPNPFPSQLIVGGIVYYTEIPDSLNSINTSSALPTYSENPTSQSHRNERFWKDYIDHVLGVQQGNVHPQSSSGQGYSVVTHYTGYGHDYAWQNGGASIRITGKPSAGATYGDPPASMDYRDNPRRPKLHFWFGPMTLVDFMGNYGAGQYGRFWWPGTCHEAPTWQCKLGIQAALLDMKQNHPNDFLSLIFFSAPMYSPGEPDTRMRFNRVRAPMGQDYDRLINSLWYPLHYLDTGEEISPYDTAVEKRIREAPFAAGSTCYPMGLMLAYNQFSSASDLRSYNDTPGAPYGDAGGLGRVGASKLLIFESDGLVTTRAFAAFTNNGAHNSYYNVRAPDEFPSNSGSDPTTQTYDIVGRICALESDSPPGYSTERKPVLVHCLAFGTIFEPDSTNPEKQEALDRLQMMQFIGGQAGGEQVTASTPLPDYKRITGTASARIAKLKKAFSQIMQGGIQVSLIE